MWIDVNLKINPSSFKSHELLYSLIALFLYISSAVTTSATWRVVQIQVCRFCSPFDRLEILATFIIAMMTFREPLAHESGFDTRWTRNLYTHRRSRVSPPQSSSTNPSYMFKPTLSQLSANAVFNICKIGWTLLIAQLSLNPSFPRQLINKH